MLPNLHAAETYIVETSRGGPTDKIAAMKESIASYMVQIDYNMTRFIDQFGSKLDVEKDDKYHKFMKIQNEEYATCTRLQRVMKAYNV